MTNLADGRRWDFGCHTLDPSFWALDLGSCDAVLATTTNQLPQVKYDSFPTCSVITYWFPKRGNKPPVKLIWYDGGITPKWDERFQHIEFGDNGALLVTDKGIIQHESHGGDAANMKVTQVESANAIIHPEFRRDWEL